MKKLKQELKQEAKIFVPDIKLEVLESVGIRENAREKKKRSYARILVPVLAVFLLVLTIPLFFTEVNAKETLVTLNINPAFLIKVEDDKVQSVDALNDEAVLVLYDEELNDDLVETIKQLVAKAKDLGYKNKPTITAYNNNKKIENKMNKHLQEKLQNCEISFDEKISSKERLYQRQKREGLDLKNLKLEDVIKKDNDYNQQNLENLRTILNQYEQEISNLNYMEEANNLNGAINQFMLDMDQAINENNETEILRRFKNFNNNVMCFGNPQYNKDEIVAYYNENKEQIKNYMYFVEEETNNYMHNMRRQIVEYLQKENYEVVDLREIVYLPEDVIEVLPPIEEYIDIDFNKAFIDQLIANISRRMRVVENRGHIFNHELFFIKEQYNILNNYLQEHETYLTDENVSLFLAEYELFINKYRR